MSQWKQIQQLEIKYLEQVDYLYDDNFPMDIRQVLSNWIESQDWDTAANHESMATVLLSNLLSQLDRQCSQEQNFLQRHNLKIINQQLQIKYKANPLLMAGVISTCLREERRIISTASIQEQGPLEKSMQNSVAFERQKNMDNRVAVIRSSVQMMDQAVKYLEDMQDDFDFRYKTLQSRDPADRNTAVMKQEVTRLQEMLNNLDFKRKLNPELMEWKRRQQINCIGGPLLTGLDQLQNWFTLIAQSLFQMKRQLDKLGELILKVTYERDPIPLQRPQMEEQVKYLIYHLIKSSFVVEKQPCMPTHPQKPLIIKTGVQFTTKFRLLTMALPRPSPFRNRQFFILTTNTKVMDVEESSNGCLSVEFRHLQLKEKKYVNGTKVNENLGFFASPQRASWGQLSEVLSWQFSTFTGRGLNREQLCMLGEKLLGQQASQNECQVSWSKFCKENIPGKNFSFWMWLDYILELIKKHLLPIWNDNCIMGFVSKETERARLKDKEPGTFLLRFSESHLGGITFTWVEQSDSGEAKFISVEPYTKSRLSALPFADIIRDYKVIADGEVPENPLKFLYPDKPKDEAFGRHYNSQQSKGKITTPPPCSSPEPPMSPGMFDMLNQHLSPLEIETAMSSPYSE
ncbi:unnamed protein product [Coregonus sp. 'balchen']|nr:unnamed protein product [Coregonus sp. 'balchen']